MAPRRVMPRDILYVLFSIYVFDLNGHPGAIILVNKEWLDVARNMSCLWTSINVTADMHWRPPHFGEIIICRTPASVDSALKWSKQRSLKIVIDIGMSGTSGAYSTKDNANIFRHVMDKYSTRVSKLTINVMPIFKKVFEVGDTLSGVFTKPLPSLKFLEILCTDLSPSVYAEISNLVAFSCAELHEISLPRSLFQDFITKGILSTTKNPRLTCTTIQKSKGEEIHYSLLSPLSSTLERLSISEDITYPTDSDTPDWHLDLSTLRVLDLGFTSVDTLSRLRLPLLTTLVINQFLTWDPQVRRAGFIVLPSLKHLQVRNISSQIICICAPSLQDFFFQMASPYEYKVKQILEDIFSCYDGFLATRHLHIHFSTRNHFALEIRWLKRLQNIESLWIHHGSLFHGYEKTFWSPLSPIHQRSSVPPLPILIRITIVDERLEGAMKVVKRLAFLKSAPHPGAFLKVDMTSHQPGSLVTLNGDDDQAPKDEDLICRL